MIFDPTYLVLVLLPTVLLGAWAQYRVKSAFSKWSRVPNQRGISGVETAQVIMQSRGLQDIAIERVGGQLTDFYDPRSKSIHLSDSSTGRPSVAAMAVVAHELGHAEQDKAGSAMLRLRASMVPAANLGSNLGVWIVILGLLMGGSWLNVAWLGVILFGAAVAFTIVTLPVEFDASRRARQNLRQLNLVVSREEESGVDQVLSAAAMTYVAAAAAAALQLLYWVSRVGGASSRD